jgi:hypothetical protein
MIRIGDRFAAQHPNALLRYDILSIFWNGYWFSTTHYADAFRPIADVRRPWIWRG